MFIVRIKHHILYEQVDIGIHRVGWKVRWVSAKSVLRKVMRGHFFAIFFTQKGAALFRMQNNLREKIH